MAKIRIILAALQIAKKNGGAGIYLGLGIPIFFIFLLLTVVISSITSWMNWTDQKPDEIQPYKDLAVLHADVGMIWQQVIALDLARHDMSQDELDASSMEKIFIYYVETDDGKKIKKLRSFEKAKKYAGLTKEQKEMADAALALYYEQSGGVTIEGGSTPVSADVLQYEDVVRSYAIQNGIEQYVDILLAMMMQESGGKLLDVMQSSESLGLPRNSITDPIYSIQVGVSGFAKRLEQSKGDVKLALQSYNFGPGFIAYANERGGYSKEVALQFSIMMAGQMGWERYGDINYVDNVLRYVQAVDTNAGTQKFDLTAVVAVMDSLMGTPYLYGGRSPSEGGIDCSGLLEYAFNKIGFKFSGTAQTMYYNTTRITDDELLPGDLVFFDTDPTKQVGHVGMYVGNGQFINSNNSHGVTYTQMSNSYWSKRYIGAGRI